MRAAWTLFHDIHRLVLSILLLTGSPFVLIGGAEAWQVWQQLLSYPTVTGMVVDNDYRATDDGGGAYYPIVAFTPVDGPSVRFTDGIGSLPADYTPGTSIEVIYNPAHVQEARIKTASHLLYGEDIRAPLAFPSIQSHLRVAIKLSTDHIATFRYIEVGALSVPLSYPDPTGPYYGYDYHEPEYGDQPGTRLLVGSVMWAATALVALKAGQLAGTKRAAIALYEQAINDEWYPLIRAIYQQCKLRWQYRIPGESSAQAELRAVCQQVLAFEEYCLRTYAHKQMVG